MSEFELYQRAKVVLDLVKAAPDIDTERLFEFAHWLSGYLSALDPKDIRNKQLIFIVEKFALVYSPKGDGR